MWLSWSVTTRWLAWALKYNVLSASVFSIPCFLFFLHDSHKRAFDTGICHNIYQKAQQASDIAKWVDNRKLTHFFVDTDTQTLNKLLSPAHWSVTGFSLSVASLLLSRGSAIFQITEEDSANKTTKPFFFFFYPSVKWTMYSVHVYYGAFTSTLDCL